MNSKDDLALLKLNETLIDYCHMKNRDCQTCLINNALKLSDECPVDLSIELINRIKNKEGGREMTEETEQEIAKRIHAISTQIENIKATQINTEQLTAVIRSSNAQVRHIQRQQNELSTGEFQQACEMIKDTAEKLDYWESRYKLVLDIMEEWDKDFMQLKVDYEMLSEADGKTNKDAEYWKQKCIDINNDYIQISKTLNESNSMLNKLRIDYANLQVEHAELTDESKVNTAVSETTVAELNKKFDNNAVKFTNAKLKADAIAMSYDELSDTLHAVEQERDKYKEKYEVTKKLLDAETSAEHTGSDSYNELYKENQQLYAALAEKEDQIDGLFKEAKLLAETKTSLVSELLDLKYLIHKLRLDDMTPEEGTNADNTDEDES